MTEEIKKIFEETKRHFDEKTEEIKRHFDVMAEDLKDKIKIIAEQVAVNTEKLEEHDQKFDAITEKLEEHDQKFDKIDETLEIIKLDIEFIKNELKQKVGRDEFAALERRVSLLEAKLKK